MLCRPLQLCASIHLLPGIPFFGTFDKTISDSQGEDNKHVRACSSRELLLVQSTHNRLERRHRNRFPFGGVGKKKVERRKTHKPSPARICCCDLVWVSRPWVRVGGSESRYQVGRARKSECRLGAGCAFGTRAPSRFGQGWVPGQAKKGTQVGGA